MMYDGMKAPPPKVAAMCGAGQKTNETVFGDVVETVEEN